MSQYSARAGRIPTQREVPMLRFGDLRQGVILKPEFQFPDDKHIAQAKVVATAINEKGRPQLPIEIKELLTNDFSSSR